MEPNAKQSARAVKARAGLLLFALAFSVVAVGSPATAQAQGMATVEGTGPLLTAIVGDTVDREVTDVLLQSATLAVVNATNYFASQIAYQAAVALASDCPGQKNCWSSKAWSQNFREAGEGAIGEAVGTLSEGLLGNNFLCSPNPLFTLTIQLGLLDELKPGPPRCDFNAIVSGWSTLIDSVETGEILKQMIPVFQPGSSPVAMSLDVMDGVIQAKAKAEEETVMQALTDAAAGGGFSAIVDPISKRVKSPQAVVENEFQTMDAARTKDPESRAAQYNAGAIAGRAAESIALNVTQTFVQTLVARLWNKMVNGLLSTEELLTFQPDIILDPEAVLVPGRSGVQQALLTRTVAATTRDAGVIDPLLDFISCQGSNVGPNNCVMDAQFANAVRLGDVTPLTVAEAIEKGMLHKDWPLIPAAAREKDRDNFCYTQGYCESNLKKLRAARIIPIGWEIAAAKSLPTSFATLGEVVSRFNDCNDDDVSDSLHPWCHLIDPNWVLKAPPTQCRAMVSGPTLVASESNGRSDICVDSPTCLRQDDFGACIGGWGYCLRERNAWRFQGDSCPAQFNSCRTLSTRSGDPVSFLMNTVMPGVCNADNVGCTAYALETNLEEDDADLTDDWESSPARYLNREAKTCNPTDNGCTAVVPLPAGTSLNLIRNGSFDDLADGDGNGSPEHPEHWSPYGSVSSGAGSASINGAKSITGQNAMRVRAYGASFGTSLDANTGDFGVCAIDDACTEADGCTCSRSYTVGSSTVTFTCAVPEGRDECSITNRVAQDGITVRRGATYTVSATFIPVGTSRTVGGRIDVRLFNSSRSAVDARNRFSESHTSSGGTGDVDCDATNFGVRMDFDGTRDQDQKGMRASCTFVVDASIASATVDLFGTASDEMYVDDVQLEEGTGTAFHEEYGAVPPTEHLKMAPSYLGCTGEATDRPECASFTQLCRANEVGCTRYSPMNGDPAVPAIVGPQDFCPAECSGYDTYKQEATNFDTEKFPVFFIPSTANQCSEAESGCSQFTDVQTEQVAYYSKLRLCEAPSTDPETVFYSWEGSDTAGFQLRVWNLKKTAAPVRASTNDVAAAAGPVGFAPCTKLGPDAVACDSRDTGSGRSTDGLCSRTNIDSGDFDCREFYDANGNRHYRQLSKTILLTADCREYRITQSTAADCAKSNGRWLTDRQQCIYSAHTQESVSCSSTANGCRPYKGNAAGNVRTALYEDFENGRNDWEGGSISDDSIVAGGHSIKLEGGGSAAKSIAGTVAPGRSYTVSFWAHGNDDLDIDFAGSSTVSIAQNVVIASGWRQYNVGPVIVSNPSWGAANVTLRFDRDGTGESFIDNIVLKEVQDNIFVVRDSWRTPVSCDSTATGVPSPQEMLGCKEYVGVNNAKTYLRSFAALCREQVIGCSAYSHTQNSVGNPYAESFNAVCERSSVCTSGNADSGSCRCNYTPLQPALGASSKPRVILSDVCRVAIGSTSCRFHYDYADYATTSASYPDRVNVVSDSRVYLVPDDKFRCGANAIGCRELGVRKQTFETQCIRAACDSSSGCDCTVNGATCRVPRGSNTCTAIFDQPQTSGWDKPTILDAPANYERSLCLKEAVSCEEFRGNDGTYYFKHPKSSICVFKEGITVNSQSVSGWFRQSDSGIDVPCNPELFRNGTLYDIAKNADPSCSLNSICDDADGCACDDGDGNECLVAEGRQRCGYQGWVGACSPETDRCEEFIDPRATSPTNPRGQPYYYLMNSKLDLKSCSGGASLEEGCVLFERTNDPALLYNAATTYARSESSANGGVVPAVNCNSSPKAVGCSNVDALTCVLNPKTSGCTRRENDSNIIIKVRRDRECAQWLACSGADSVWDQSNGQWKNVCTQLDACEQQRNVGDSQECSRWSDVPNEKLTELEYTGRNTSYTGYEYSGYSLPGKFPVQYVGLAKPSSTLNRKLYGVPNSDRPTCSFVTTMVPEPCEETEIATVYGAPVTACIPQFRSVLAESCTCPNGGVASAGKCYFDITGQPLDDEDSEDTGQCRGYPEQDSPFDRTILESGSGVEQRKSGFRGANVCADGNVCDCSYLRTGYGTSGATERFVSLMNPINVYSKICSGGPKDGDDCELQSADNDICNKNEGGTCISKTRLTSVVGWEGYCVDPDYSFNIGGDQTRYGCNLWLPVDRLPGAPDLSNQEKAAGFIPTGEHMYCSVAEGNKNDNRPDILSNLNALVDGEDSYIIDSLPLYSAVSLLGGAITRDGLSEGQARMATDPFGNSAFLICPQDNDVSINDQKGRVAPGIPVDMNDVAYIMVKILAGDRLSLMDMGRWDGSLLYRQPVFLLYEGNGWAATTAGEGCPISDNAMPCSNIFAQQRDNGGDDTRQKIKVKANWNGNSLLNIAVSGDNEDQDGAGNCDDDDPVYYVYPYAVMREQCTEVKTTTKMDETHSTAVAWTNRIWEGYSSKSNGYDFAHASTNFEEDIDQTPFGRIRQTFDFRVVDGIRTRINFSAVNESDEEGVDSNVNWPLQVWTTEGGSVGGMHITCGSGDDMKHDNNCDCDQDHYDGADDRCTIKFDGGYTASGIPFACKGDCRYSGSGGVPGLNDDWDGAGSSNASVLAAERLSRIFARVYDTYRWNAGSASGRYDRTTSIVGETDFRATYATVNTAPKVRSVNTQACVGVEGNCPEGSEGMTINNFMSGVLTGTGGKFRAVIKFYAWADKDHMPIRKRVIEFGDDDGDAPGGNNSFYKNHRGCKTKPDGTCAGNEQICATSAAEADDWGVHPDACTTGYFSITQQYICTSSRIRDLSTCSSSGTTYPCKRSVAIPGLGSVEACVFKPRVRIVDNWGQCNGICPLGAGEGNVCINDIGDPDIDFDYDVGSGECKQTTADSWTYYDGEIILAPR